MNLVDHHQAVQTFAQVKLWGGQFCPVKLGLHVQIHAAVGMRKLVRDGGFTGLARAQHGHSRVLAQVFAEAGKGAAIQHPCILII